MYPENTAAPVDPSIAVRTVRIIVIALSFGMISSMVVFWLVGPLGSGDPTEERMWLGVVVGFGALCAVGWQVASKVLISSLRRRWASETDREELERGLVPGFINYHILGSALTEGPGLLAAVIYLLTGSPFALAAVALALFILIRFYPREDGYQRFVDSVSTMRTAPS